MLHIAVRTQLLQITLCGCIYHLPLHTKLWIKFNDLYKITIITLTTEWLLYSTNAPTNKSQQPNSTLWMVHKSVLLFGSKLCHSQILPWHTVLEEMGNQFSSRYVQTAVQTILNKRGKYFQKEASNSPKNQGQDGDEDTKSGLLATEPPPCDPHHFQLRLIVLNTAIWFFGLYSSDTLKSKYELKATFKM